MKLIRVAPPAAVLLMAALLSNPAHAQSLTVVWKGRTLVNAPRFSGVGSSTKVVAHRDGTGKAQILLPGPIEPGRITLQYPAVRNDPLLAWREAVLRGDLARARRQITVIVHDSRSREVVRFTLRRAWPSRYRLSSEQVVPGTPMAEVALVFEGPPQRPGQPGARAVLPPRTVVPRLLPVRVRRLEIQRREAERREAERRERQRERSREGRR